MERQWTKSSNPAKLSVSDKARIVDTVQKLISSSSRLKEIVNRFEVRAGKIYLYRLHEQFGWDNPEFQFIKPLINGRYKEVPLARITLYGPQGYRCEVGWQRHTGQWMNVFEGNITRCFEFIEADEEWFH